MSFIYETPADNTPRSFKEAEVEEYTPPPMKVLAQTIVETGTTATVQPLEVETGTTGTPSTPFYYKVKGNVMIILGRVGDTIVSIKVRVGETLEVVKVRVLKATAGARKAVGSYADATSAKAVALYASTKDKAATTLKLYYAKGQSGVVYIKGRVGDKLIAMKAMPAQLGDAAKAKALSAYASTLAATRKYTEPAKARALELYVSAKAGVIAKCGPYYNLASEKVVYVKGIVDGKVVMIKARVLEISKPVTSRVGVASGIVYKRIEPYYVKVKDNVVYIKGRVGGKIVLMKASAIEKCDIVKAKAMKTYASTLKAIEAYVSTIKAKLSTLLKSAKAKASLAFEPYYVKMQDGLMYVKGSIGNTKVYIKTKVSESRDMAAKTMEITYAKVKGSVLHIKAKLGDAVVYIKVRLSESCADTLKRIEVHAGPTVNKVLKVVDDTKTQALQRIVVIGNTAKDLAKDSKVQVTAAGAASGAVAVGTTGAVGGGVVGAACGVVPALFTFGLSIPVGAAIGSGAGFCLGAVTGGVAGGAAGYGGYKHRAAIESGVSACKQRVNAAKEAVKSKMTSGTGGSA